MRVLHAQKIAGVAGSERHLLTLLPALAAAGAEVRMCALTATDDGAGEFGERMRAAGVPVSCVPVGADADPRLVVRLRREIRGFGADLLHTHLIHADLHGQLAARLAAVPGVSSVHGTHPFYERQPVLTLARAAGRSARRTIAISAHVGSFLERRRIVPPDRIRVIHYGIDAGDWEERDGDRGAARAALEVADDAVVVGVASRLVAHKGHEFLLEAFSLARAAAPELELVLAGEGPLRGELERRARKLGVPARFLGFVPAIHEFMWACDVIAFPSQPQFGEGFGLAALEAMAAGRPVVATAVSSLPEVVGKPGPEAGGVLVDPGDPAALAAVLVELAGDARRRERIGEAARRRAVDRFGVPAMVESTIATYRETLG